MVTLAACLALMAGASVQDEAGDALRKAREAREKCERLLKGVEGAAIIGHGGAGGVYRIIVRYRDAEARAEAGKRLGGDKVDGVAILWTLQNAETPQTEKPAPKPEAPPPAVAKPGAPKPTVFEGDPDNPWKASVTDCDIVRDYLKMKPARHPLRNGFFSDPCQLVQRSVIGGGGGHTYLYTKHRDECPIRLGRVTQPAWADNFVAWVFQKGFTPVQRAGFLWPTELRADDKLWDRQATEELKTRLPYIREGAEWTFAEGAFVKVTTPGFSGSARTGGGAGLGWTWSAPMTPLNFQPPATATGGGSKK